MLLLLPVPYPAPHHMSEPPAVVAARAVPGASSPGNVACRALLTGTGGQVGGIPQTATKLSQADSSFCQRQRIVANLRRHGSTSLLTRTTHGTCGRDRPRYYQLRRR